MRHVSHPCCEIRLYKTIFGTLCRNFACIGHSYFLCTLDSCKTRGYENTQNRCHHINYTSSHISLNSDDFHSSMLYES